MKCVVIGLGEFGYASALQLSQAGREVIALDANMDLIEKIKDQVALAVQVDARDERALAAHGVGTADVVIAAIGADFEAQVLSVVHCRALGVPRIVARATTKDHRRVLLAVGAHEVLNPEEEAARHVVQRLMIPDIIRYLELAEGFSVVELRSPASVVGKSLRALNLRQRFRLNLVALVDVPEAEGEASRHFDPIPDPERPLRSTDVLVMVGSDIDFARFVDEHP
ncbi:MAG: TrkA family potassium uptake protein [Planctomycetota bacterium]